MIFSVTVTDNFNVFQINSAFSGLFIKSDTTPKVVFLGAMRELEASEGWRGNYFFT